MSKLADKPIGATHTVEYGSDEFGRPYINDGHPGMTLREHYVGLFHAVLLSNAAGCGAEQRASMAKKEADALIRELEKTQQ